MYAHIEYAQDNVSYIIAPLITILNKLCHIICIKEFPNYKIV